MKIKSNWILKNISISQLDDLSNTFNWFPGNLPDCHRNSIEEDGIHLPLLVQSVEDSKFRLVDGFKRLRWLKSAKGNSVEEYQHDHLPCLIIPAFVSIKNLFKIRLETLSADQNSFSGIYLCRVLKMLSESGFSKNEIAFKVFPSLGLISSVRLAGQLLDLQQKLVRTELHDELLFPESIMSMGYEDLLPLLKFSSSDLPSVLRLAEIMEVKGKKWRNLLQVLDEIIRLRQIATAEILHYHEINKILEDSNLQGPVRYRLLKEQLDSLRYPELSKMLKRFDQTTKRLKLPKQMTLESDQYFEKNELTLKFEFSSLVELREHLMNLSDTVNSEDLIKVWNDLFAILHEE